MAEWKLELSEDVIRHIHPSFSSLEERIAFYEDYYLSAAVASPVVDGFLADGSSQRAVSAPATVAFAEDPSQVSVTFPTSISSFDERKTSSPFSTLLALYGSDGEEYTFSRMGMRHMKRSLPWQGHYHTHD